MLMGFLRYCLIFDDEILDQYDGFDGDIDDVHAFLEQQLEGMEEGVELKTVDCAAVL